MVDRFHLSQAKPAQVAADPALNKLLNSSTLSANKEPDKSLDTLNKTTPMKESSTRVIQSESGKVEKEEIFPYREAIGALSFIAHTVRPDIAFAINRCAQFNHCFNHLHITPSKQQRILFDI